MNGLLDTSILIDLLRNYPSALSWFSEKPLILGVTRAVWFEIIQGVENGQKQQQALNLLRRFTLVEFTTSDLMWATDMLVRYKLSHNIGIFDCLIASVAHRVQLPVYTLNLKDFRVLVGNLAQKPY